MVDHFTERSSPPSAKSMEQGLLGLSLPVGAHQSLAGRIYEGIREAIVAGRLVSNQRLPSTRALADELSVARGTVVEAYDQLRLEGYVRTRRGSGTYIDEIPEQFLHAPATSEIPNAKSALPQAAARARGPHLPLVDYAQARLPRPFQPGLAPLDAFPRHIMSRLSAEAVRTLTFDELAYGDPGGYLPLREAVASYLGTARAVACSPERVMITNGAQHALGLAAHVLLDAGESVWMENPGYRGARVAFAKAGLKVIPVPVDADGISIETGLERAPDARLVYVTPSHQYPLGVTMSARRRLELIEWATRSGAWILEDDYDSEYRYDGAPLPALHHFDGNGRVLYVGSFSKVLAPGLRIGYLVVPAALIDVFTRIRASDDHHSSIVAQITLSEFIARGHYGRHLRRMRKLGALRRDALVECFAHRLPRVSLAGTEGGLHALLRLDPSIDDALLAARAAERGLSLSPLSAYNIAAPHLNADPSEGDASPTARRRPDEKANGLVLGYAAYTEKQIDAAVARLAELLGAAEGA